MPPHIVHGGFPREAPQGNPEPMEAAGISSDLRDEFAHSSKDDSPVPALDAERGSFAERIGNRLTGLHPILVFLAGIVLCYLVLASITLAVGLIFTDAILPLGSLDEADSRPVEWLADNGQRRSPICRSSGSEISGGIVLPILVGLLAIAFAIRRHWLLAAFVIFELLSSRRHTARPCSSSTESGLTFRVSKACLPTTAFLPGTLPPRS